MSLHLPTGDARRPRVLTAAARLGRRGPVLVSTTLAFTAAGIAFAAWTVPGDGPGSARAATPVQVTVTADPGQPADLYPGGEAGTLYFRLDNPNGGDVTFTSMTPGAVSVDGAHAACDPGTHVTVVGRTGLSVSVPADTPSGTPVQRSIASAVTLDGNAPDSCQGALFTVALTLTGSLSG